MKKILKWGGIILVVLVIISMIGNSNNSKTSTSTPSPSPTVQAQPTNQPTITTEANPTAIPQELVADKFLTHEELLAMSSKPNELIGKTFEMKLYLEQQPTRVSADFITQTDTNDMNTILMTCNMKSTDLAKLDGASAQKAIYTKVYPVEITFREFSDLAGPYFKADCTLQ